MISEEAQAPVCEAGPAAALAIAAAAALAACGGGGGGGAPGSAAAVGDGSASGGGTPGTPPALNTVGFSFPAPASDEQAARFLLQAQFSASEAEIAAVRADGYAKWLAAQMAAAPSQSGWEWLQAKGYGDATSNQNYYDQSFPGDYMVWNQLITTSEQVRKRVALALSEFFVVSLSALDITWRSHAIASWWDTLAAGAFGNFRALLEAVSLHPAMGYYLNTRGNQKENPATGRVPDENFAREIMQLMSIGLAQLNADGTPRLDAAGAPLESYTQADVTNLARVFTGYDFDQSQNVPTVVGGRTISGTAYVRLPMVLNATRHSTLAVSFLGTDIAANTPGAAALKAALDALFAHPNVGPFFGRQMIQRLVTSNPTPAYVARVAAAFDNNGRGVRGDLAAVFAAVLLDDEARSPSVALQPGAGKLREPMLRFVQWARTCGLASASDGWRISDLSNPANQLGQSPLRSPTVFNFFRPGYVPPSTALASSQAVAPEFQIVNESSVGGYLNFMQNTLRNGINGDLQPAYTAELAIVTDAAALVRRLNLLLCAGQLSAETQALITNALNATAVTAASSDANKRNRVAAGVLMVMASAEYLVQK
ncbi:MAG: DUF1800 domain-containing protein [Burkholderiales bacterium]|nr:DUF1800 domain-containing protein [Burkholderiales bacterium]